MDLTVEPVVAQHRQFLAGAGLTHSRSATVWRTIVVHGLHRLALAGIRTCRLYAVRLRSPISLAGLLLAACLAPASERTAQWGHVGGTIRHVSGAFAVNVPVTVINESTLRSTTVRSDRHGSYRSPPVPAGSYSVRIELAGCKTFVRAGVQVSPGSVFLQDAVLVRLPAAGVDGRQEDCRGSRIGSDANHGVRVASRTASVAESGGPVGPHREPVSEARRLAQSPARAKSGFLAAPAKRSSNEFHGALYYSLGNDRLNARGFFGNESGSRRNRYGAFVGGPVVKDKTFFSYHWEKLAVRDGVQSGFGNSVPVQPFRSGDFSRLATGRHLAADALGRPVLEGQIFDPASTRTVGGIPVRDPLPDNIMPAAHPLRSRVASRVLPFMARPERPGMEFNVQGNPFGNQIWVLEAPSHHFRLTHAFVSAWRASFDLSRTSHPALRSCGGPNGCEVRFDPVRLPERNSDYYGTGLHEDVTTHHARLKLDWTASPNILNHAVVEYDEFHLTGHSIAAGAQWPRRLWGPGGNGLLANDGGPPEFTFSGNTRYSTLGSEQGRSGFLANHRYRVSNHLTWVRRRHLINFGGEFRHHRYPFRAWASNVAGSFNFHRMHTGGYDAAGNNLPQTGDPFASFLFGQVNSTRFQIPDSPTITDNFVSWSVVDRVRFTSALTVTFGLRFDYQSALRERDDNMSTFDPSAPNPGAGGRLGAMIFAGEGAGRTGLRTLESPPVDAFGPRVGFAYRLGDSSVVRGSYGIQYASVPHAQFDAVNTLGFRFHATANDLTNGRRPAYFLDDGFPRSNIVLPPAVDPAVGNNTSPVAVTMDRATLPRVQLWSLALQRQLARRTSVSLAYEGNRGSRLTADRRVLGPAANANATSVLDLGPSLLSSPAGSSGVGAPYAGFSGSAAQSLRPFPQMLNIGYLNVPAGNSFYHGLRLRLETRFSGRFQMRGEYLWSKLTGMGAGRHQAWDGLGYGPQNPTDTHSLERGLSLDDVPHRAVAAFTHQLPFFRQGREGLVARVLGGWSLSGMVRINAGTPVNVVMANDLEPFLFNSQKRPDILTERVRVDHRDSFRDTTDSILDRAAFSDPGPLNFGSASRTMNFVRGPGHVAEDFRLYKDAWVNPKFKVRFETQLANAFNRVVFCNPNRNWSASSFGRVFSQCNSPRSVQFGLRLDF